MKCRRLSVKSFSTFLANYNVHLDCGNLPHLILYSAIIQRMSSENTITLICLNDCQDYLAKDIFFIENVLKIFFILSTHIFSAKITVN